MKNIDIKTKIFYYTVSLINMISLFLAFERIDNQSNLLFFLLIPIVCVCVILQYYKNTTVELLKKVLIFLVSCLLPIEAILMLTNKSIENWFIKIDKTVFFFVYNKKIIVLMFLITFILSELFFDRYIKDKGLNILFSFLFAVSVLFVYNSI